MSFLRRRLREASTWRGLIGLLTLAGVSLSPEQTEAIIAAAVAIYLVVETFLPDNLDEKQYNSTEPSSDGVRGTNQQELLNQAERNAQRRVADVDQAKGRFTS